MNKRPTIKDIARIAGVTHSTVSRIINKNPSISEKTQKKVLKIIEKMNYHPNLIARGLVRKKTRAFAMIVPELNPHVLLVLKGVADTCRRLNYGLMLFSTDYWADENLFFLEISRNWQVDGILIYNVVYHEDVSNAVKELNKEKVPFVFINKYLGTGKANTVGIDNREAVLKAMEYLVNSLGHKKIGIMNGGMLSSDGVERFEGYKEALKKLNLPYNEDYVGYGNFGDIDAYQEMKRILNSGRYPTAVFCADDLMAVGVIKAIEEKGLQVPRDISVVGFDDWEGARYFKPALTTIKPPLMDIGFHAINLLIKAIKEPKKEVTEIPLKASLIIRESTAEVRNPEKS